MRRKSPGGRCVEPGACQRWVIATLVAVGNTRGNPGGDHSIRKHSQCSIIPDYRNSIKVDA